MALRSARMPAPPEGSTPAILKTFGMCLLMVFAITGERFPLRTHGSDQAGHGRAGTAGINPTWDASGQKRFASRHNPMAHGARHAHRITRLSNSGIHQHPI